MESTSASLQPGIEAAKQAGAERVASAREALARTTPGSAEVASRIAKPGMAQVAKSALKGILPQLTGAGVAYELFQNPELKAQREAALQSGLKKVGASKDNVYGLPVEPSSATAAPVEATLAEKAFPVGTPLPGGGTAGDKEPAIDMSRPTINTKVEAPVEKPKPAVSTEPQAPSFRKEEIEGFAKDRGQAVSKGQGGNFRYVQGPNGQIVKQNTDTGEAVPMSVQGLTGNIIKEGEEGPLAREVRERKETAATAREEAFRNALLQMAQSQGDGSFTGMGQAKRDRRMAQFLLGQLNAQQQAGAQNALEREKMGITERNTQATLEQNRLAKAAEQEYKNKRLEQEERKISASESAAENKPMRETYKGQTFQGTKESIEQQKADYDREIQAKSWDKANPKPSGVLATNSDTVKHYQARAKALGYNPDIGKAAIQASSIAALLGKVTPEQAEELSAEFQRKYGVPYSEFIMEE